MINPLKPWYLYRPLQVLRRLRCSVGSPRSEEIVTLPWQCVIQVDGTKTIGQSLARTGIYDLATSELLWRLIRPGDQVLDIGANIGYMTSLMGRRAGRDGLVLAFEPHPRIFQRLMKNVERCSLSNEFANVQLFQKAVSDHDGKVPLICPPGFMNNDGIARVDIGGANGDDAISVETVMLDSLLVDRGGFSVAKIDVEGHELQVLRGGTDFFSRRVKHVVFEEHEGEASRVCEFLQQLGFTLLQFGWSLSRLNFAPVGQGRLTKRYESPNFLATRDADEVVQRCQASGWQVLQGGAST